MNEETEIKPIYRHWWFWGLVAVVIFVLGAGGIVAYKKFNPEQTNNNKTGDQIFGKPKYLEVFPVKLEDFIEPPQMYGLWPYGIKGNDSSSHNEGHPGWDFELKKGSKLYAVSDLTIFQIHDGDKTTGDVKPKVIEAYANLADGKFHIVYHSVINIEPTVAEGVTIKKGEILAEVGFPLSENSAMIHFGVFPPHDSVGTCPSSYFAPELQATIQQIVDLSIDNDTGEPFASACVGKINKDLYMSNYPNQVQYLGGAEQWE